MNLRDIFSEQSDTPLREHYAAAGAVCAIQTNAQPILAAARESFVCVPEPELSPDFVMRLWVDNAAAGRPPWPQPYFRGLGHLVFAGFEAENCVLVDLRRRRAIGRFSTAMVADQTYWQRVIFPSLFGIISGSIGITPLHCACVSLDGQGLLLAGVSGSGKSTLSLALAQTGFTFVSDDWTYLSRRRGQLLAWNLDTPLKLLPDAIGHFPALARLEPGISLNGELAYEVDPKQLFGVRRSLCCEPRWLMFLERKEIPEFSLRTMRAAEAAARFEAQLEALPEELSDARQVQSTTIQRLVQIPAWELRYGGKPQVVAEYLARLCERGSKIAHPELQGDDEKWVHVDRSSEDLLRRFTPTGLHAELQFKNQIVRLETNSPIILDQAKRALQLNGKAHSEHPHFLWRLVAEPDVALSPPWPEFFAFADRGLHCVSIGQRSFLAVDRGMRKGVGFLAEDLAKDGVGFREPFLATLLSMTAKALEVAPGG